MVGARICTGAPTTGFSHGACDQNALSVIATASPALPGLSGTDVASLGTLGSDKETNGMGTSTPGKSGIPGERGMLGKKSGP